MKPLISIIIPAYNRANILQETLDSVATQTYSNWQCIIVDDGSTDNTFEVVSSYISEDLRFQYFNRPSEKVSGASSCRNYGLENAKGEYIIFLDSDDLLVPTCLENRIKFAEENLDFDFWIFKMLAFEGKISHVKFICENIHVKDESLWCRKEFAKGIHPFLVMGPLWKKKALIHLGGFNEKLTMLDDLELHLRALSNGFRLKYANIDDADCYYRMYNSPNKYPLKKVLKNNLSFFKIYLNKEDKESLFHFKTMINKVVLDKKQFKGFYHFCFLAIDKKILTIKNVFFGFLILIYNLLGFNKFQYIGYNLFKKKFNNF